MTKIEKPAPSYDEIIAFFQRRNPLLLREECQVLAAAFGILPPTQPNASHPGRLKRVIAWLRP